MSDLSEHVDAHRSIRLSKSKIAAFQHCPRRLWLQVHRRHLAQFDEQTLALFTCGHQVGELARLRYRNGILVTEDHRNVVGALVRTKQLLDAQNHRPIFEAAFERDGVIVRADVLEPDGWGGWRLIEVKNADRVKPYQLHDLATQAWVIRGSDVCISTLTLRHLARRMRAASLVRSPVRFVDADVTAEVAAIVPRREELVSRARAVLAQPEPAVAPGGHCDRPTCEFRTHCLSVAAAQSNTEPR
ncbi:hypothetical protein [Parafrankia sp. BMG5.11]|uniref:hypothetical protein n=1 Tax=Parafrankia sp. BMG5.11 TaxID=222540 RepID=UPI001039D97B|nr:hypothetical protein [Parafrankia sp. BMG5.11]